MSAVSAALFAGLMSGGLLMLGTIAAAFARVRAPQTDCPESMPPAGGEP